MRIWCVSKCLAERTPYESYTEPAGLADKTLKSQDPNHFPSAGVVREVFAHFGPVTRVTVLSMGAPGLSVLIQFAHPISASALIQSNGLELGGRKILTRRFGLLPMLPDLSSPTTPQLPPPTFDPFGRDQSDHPGLMNRAFDMFGRNTAHHSGSRLNAESLPFIPPTRAPSTSRSEPQGMPPVADIVDSPNLSTEFANAELSSSQSPSGSGSGGRSRSGSLTDTTKRSDETSKSGKSVSTGRTMLGGWSSSATRVEGGEDETQEMKEKGLGVGRKVLGLGNGADRWSASAAWCEWFRLAIQVTRPESSPSSTADCSAQREPWRADVSRQRAFNALSTKIPNYTHVLTPAQVIASRYPTRTASQQQLTSIAFPTSDMLGGLGSSDLPFFGFFNTPFGSFSGATNLQVSASTHPAQQEGRRTSKHRRLTFCIYITQAPPRLHDHSHAPPILAQLTLARPLARSILTLPYMLPHKWTYKYPLTHTLSRTADVHDLAPTTHVSPPLNLPRTRPDSCASVTLMRYIHTSMHNIHTIY